MTKHKIISSVLGTIHASFLITLFVFVYQYMWFSIVTIPPGRCLVAIIGSLFSAVAFWGYINIELPKDL